MEEQRKLLHKIIRRLADAVTIVFVLICILFGMRGF